MRAQNELSPYFMEIERRTDRALAGIRQVRRAPKFRGFPAEPRGAPLGTAFLVVLAVFCALFLD